jgi:hypothetical protein
MSMGNVLTMLPLLLASAIVRADAPAAGDVLNGGRSAEAEIVVRERSRSARRKKAARDDARTAFSLTI